MFLNKGRLHRNIRPWRALCLLLCLMYLLIPSSSRAEEWKWYDASSLSWYSRSGENDFSHKVVPGKDGTMLVINHDWYPVFLWNDEPFTYQDGKIYHMLVLLKAEGGSVFIGPDYMGNGGLSIQPISDDSGPQTDSAWCYISKIFSARSFAVARPYVRFSDGLGGKVRTIYIREIGSAEEAAVPAVPDLDDPMPLDPEMFRLATQPPLSRLTLPPLDPGVKATPVPAPGRRLP